MAASLLQNCLDEKPGYVDDDCWSSARREKTACYEKVVESHRGNKTQKENALAAALNKSAASSPIVTSPGQAFKDCPECSEMLVVPAGTFLMDENNLFAAREFFPRRVIIRQSFAMAKTVVKQGQWRAIMGVNPRKFLNCGDNCPCGDDCPVGSASWEDTHEFIRRLNQKNGKQYRLPSEAEWEYALGLRDMRGVFDMTNPVFEWVEDSLPDSSTDGSARQWNSGKHIIRGGLWLNSPELLHKAIRDGAEPALRENRLGIRLARMLP